MKDKKEEEKRRAEKKKKKKAKVEIIRDNLLYIYNRRDKTDI